MAVLTLEGVLVLTGNQSDQDGEKLFGEGLPGQKQEKIKSRRVEKSPAASFLAQCGGKAVFHSLLQQPPVL